MMIDCALHMSSPLVVCTVSHAALQAWLGSRHVAVGTKCNKLLRVDTETMAVLEVQTPLVSFELSHALGFLITVGRTAIDQSA